MLSLRRAGKKTSHHDFLSPAQQRSHGNIQHTVRYTELAPDRFKDFWR
jgi:type 1 fimbriae regulatory protein FimB/type 1 fimbriae regulatory protein FimE